MLSRAGILMLALGVLFAVPAGGAVANERDEAAFRRDDDYSEVVVQSDDDGDDTNTNSRYTSGVDSNDRTGSGHSAVSRDRDRSRGDRTRDWTRDGGDRKRDWTGNHTNDRSRNDTR
ncbi:MAG: hypothetical protein ACRDJS_04735 [Actinomycetota bacterium]